MESKTLLEIIKIDVARRGHKGPLTRDMIAEWGKNNPTYCKRDGTLWPLWARYRSGSALPMMGNDAMGRIMYAWCAAGHPWPGKPGFSWDDYQVFADGYTDELIELESDGNRKLIALTGDGKAIYR